MPECPNDVDFKRVNLKPFKCQGVEKGDHNEIRKIRRFFRQCRDDIKRDEKKILKNGNDGKRRDKDDIDIR